MGSFDSVFTPFGGVLNGNLVVWTSDGVGYLNCGGSGGDLSPPSNQASALLKFSSTFLGLIWQRKR